MTANHKSIRLGADIGGTFTDVAMDVDGEIFSAKQLTNYGAPEQAVLDGIDIVIAQAGVGFADLDIVIHGTTLATNALIERRGAKTALITTEGFRDVIEMRSENRFEQYDLNLQLPAPLIPRQDRYTVAGRIAADGSELAPLDVDALETLADKLRDEGYQSVAIGFIHSYVNSAHERRARDVLAADLPGVSISISSEVSPQMREFERFNTVCANAYVRPQVADYLQHLQRRLTERGAHCPLSMIHSGGGLMSVETAMAYPVRLVESGPAGGAIFAADYAARFGLDKVLSFDMGGTTAKICLIENKTPSTARTFEVARTYRFKKGSGMPISIPVIEMIEIGAGGGSIAWVDSMGRIQCGPESAASDPGPACYQRGGERPAITDADLILGKIDPDNFAGGEMALSTTASSTAIERDVGTNLSLDVQAAAFGICEVVDENMANAARVHAVESGKNVSDNVMIAFGGAAPLHAARLCEKLGIDQCLIPPGAGVGSAIGFLRAPFAYEAVTSQLLRLAAFEPQVVNKLIGDLKATAENFVNEGASDDASASMNCEVVAFMRYVGQGWEIPVALPNRALTDADTALLQSLFEKAYANFFGRVINGVGLEIEIVSWSVKTSIPRPNPELIELSDARSEALADTTRMVFDAGLGKALDSQIVSRTTMRCGDRVVGPAVIVENETSSVVTAAFAVVMQSDGSLLLSRTTQAGETHE